MNQLPTTLGTKFTVKNNPSLGVLTTYKHMVEIDADGNQTLTHVKYIDSDGVEKGCTPVQLFNEQWFAPHD